MTQTQPDWYTKKPVRVQAIQYDGSFECRAALRKWGVEIDSIVNRSMLFWCAKANNLVWVDEGGWVAAEPDGSGFYPITEQDFADCYE